MGVIAAVLIWLSVGYLWLMHFLYTWEHDMMAMFLAGMLVPPIGIIHGALVVLGVV